MSESLLPQVSPLVERELHRAVSPLIILDTADELAIREAIRQGLEIERVTRGVADGAYSLWEAMELLEAFGLPMDQWTDEIAFNLECTFGLD